MIARELVILLLVSVGFIAAIWAYLSAFHGEAPAKEVLSTAFAAVAGVYVGRYLERRLLHGR